MKINISFSPLIALIPVFVLILMLFLTIRIFGSTALEGASQISLLVSTAVCILIALYIYRITWKDIEKAITDQIGGVATAILILLVIGALAGVWMVSGIVPAMIYYGIHIIHPQFFLVSTCIICAVISLVTGSSWTTIATIGIALLGIGKAQGFEVGWIAGAIISGAYFGDKLSPLSDTTTLAASVTNTPLFSHIRYMMFTTIPSLFITLVIFTIIGFTHTVTDTSQMTYFAQALNEKFHIHIGLLIVPVLTAVLVGGKIPAVAALFLSAVAAGLLALFFQPGLIQEISGMPEPGFTSQFKGLMMTFYGSTQLDMQSPMLNELVATRGMAGMMNTIWLIICAMCFGGAMTASGMLKSLSLLFVRFMKRTSGTVTSTALSGIILNMATADQYISIILTGKMFKNVYHSRGYESRLLSRTTEDAVTVTSVLIPWNTCGMTQATILSVPTLVYLPYCFFNILSPLMSIAVATLGYKIFRKNNLSEGFSHIDVK